MFFCLSMVQLHGMMTPTLGRSLVVISSHAGLPARVFGTVLFLYTAQSAAKEFGIISNQVARNHTLQDWKQYLKNKVQPNSITSNTVPTESVVGVSQAENIIAQAAKTEAMQNARTSGMFSSAQNTTNNYTTIHHTNHYAAPGWADSFFTWLKEGKQTRAVGIGVGIGFGLGYVTQVIRAKFTETKK